VAFSSLDTMKHDRTELDAIEQADTELVADEPFFAPAATDMVDGLVGQYQVMRRRIEDLAATVTGETVGAIQYFLDGNVDSRDRRYSTSVEKLFAAEGAIAALNSAYWSKALALTDVLDLMPQKRRDEWNKSIIEQATPDFEEETVRSTITDLLNMRSQFLAERVDGLFRSLSGDHVTNVPEGFGKRMIVSRVVNEWSTADHSRAGIINDLRCVIAKFMGRDDPRYDMTARDVTRARKEPGEWVTLDGGALRIRVYKVGTAHLEVHPLMAYRLNQILAHLYPLAIPPQFRARPKKPPKDFVMMGKPLPFEVLNILAQMKPVREFVERVGDFRKETRELPNTLDFHHGERPKAAGKVACEVLEGIGGVRQKKGHLRFWQFDYNPGPVVDQIVSSGCVPDQRAHQFYPTPRELAERVVEAAEIQPGHSVLEPSSGQGGLADVIAEHGIEPLCIEIAPLNCGVLEAKGRRVLNADFLSWSEACSDRFDRIVMNPPFSEGRAKLHTLTAAGLLKPGGLLVAVLPVSHRGQIDIPGYAAEWTAPIENAFPGVSVTVAILTLHRKA
jgi:hypothetical protein